METKKKPNIVLYTLLMIVVFFVITELFIWGYGRSVILEAIYSYPQGSLVISEAVLSALVLIVMVKFGNFYVFTEGKGQFRRGLGLGVYYIIGSVFFTLIFGVLYGGLFTGLTVLNLLIGCLFVGIAEELLCRGWLLNEFLERFGDTKFGVWYSIIISGLIFGLMHIGNIFSSGQSVPDTMVQVLNAAVTGLMYGIIYYKTKNIWSVIVLHAFWDFSLFLGDAVPVTEATVRLSSVSAGSVFASVMMVLALLINVLPYLKGIDRDPDKKLIVICAVISFVLFNFFTMNTAVEQNEYGDTYEYSLVELDEYSITTDNRTSYEMEYSDGENGYSFALRYEHYALKLVNLRTGYSVSLPFNELYDYRIVENVDYFVLAYIDNDENSNPFMRYAYISKSDISDENSFMEKVKTDMKEYLLPDLGSIVVITDREDNTSYITLSTEDYGYYILVSEDSMALMY